MAWLEPLEVYVANGPWWLFLAVLVVVLLVVNRVVRWTLVFLWNRDQPEKKVWRSAIYRASDAPLRAAVWLLGIIIAFRHFFPPHSGYPVIDRVNGPTQNVLFIFVVGWFLFRLIGRVEDNYFKRASAKGHHVDRTAATAIRKIATAVVFLVVALSTVQALGISIAGLLAFGGAAGIAVGFAAQNLVSNLFGGLTVFASRIFRLDEDIVLRNTGISGTVVNIGWRSTTIEAWNGKRIYVPNAVFNTHSLTNHSRLKHREMSQDILLRYDDYDRVQTVVEEGNKLLAKRDDLNYFVFRFAGFGDKALKLNVYAWIQSVPGGSFVPYADFAEAQEEILMDIADIARNNGCEVLPLNHVWLKELPQPQPASGMPAGVATTVDT